MISATSMIYMFKESTPYRTQPQLFYPKIPKNEPNLICEFFGHKQKIIAPKSLLNNRIDRNNKFQFNFFLTAVQLECSRCKTILKTFDEKWPSSIQIGFFLETKIMYHFLNLYTPNELLTIDRTGFIEL